MTFSFAFGGPVCSALFKSHVADFKVVEILPFEPQIELRRKSSGASNHWLVRVEKQQVNTLDVLTQMSSALGVSRKAMGYSGLKDKLGVCQQWISVPASHLTRNEILVQYNDDWRVLECFRHQRKLRVGSHKENRFKIVLRRAACMLTQPPQRQEIEQKIKQITTHGVPNYFGPQRFGNRGSNLVKAKKLLWHGRRLPRQQHRFAVSAARALIFNEILDRRVSAGNWNQIVNGEVIALAGTNSWFEFEKLEDNGDRRLAAHDIHPSAPLWGHGALRSSGEALVIEQAVVANYMRFAEALEQLGLKQERRALRLSVCDLDYSWHKDHLTLSFTLTKGAFATSVVRELIEHDELDYSIPECGFQGVSGSNLK